MNEMKAVDDMAQMRERLQKLAPEHDVAATNLVTLIQRLSNQISRAIDQRLADKPVHSSGVDVLLALQHAGAMPSKKRAPSPGVKLSTLSKQMNVTPASITNRIDQLLKAGLVSREIDVKDKRVAYVRLTESGVAMVGEVLPAILDVHTTVAKSVKKGDRKDLVKCLTKLSESLEG